MAELPTNLWNFAYCDVRKYETLAEEAEPEDWGTDNNRLQGYVSYVYERAATLYNREESDFLYVGKSEVCFDTGLFTEVFEPIYALLRPNDEGRQQKWRLTGFFC